MTDLLFDAPETPLSALQSARLRMDAAQKAYDAAYQTFHDHNDPVPYDVNEEYKEAVKALRNAEANELRRLRE
jgi:hypothetical protein